MGGFTAGWGWPQWAIVVILFLGFAITASQHGKPKVDKDGNPDTYSGFIAIGRVALWSFILIAGGFFR